MTLSKGAIAEKTAEDLRIIVQMIREYRSNHARPDLTVERVQEILESGGPRGCPKIRDIIEEVSKFYGVSEVHLKSARRNWEYMKPRKIIYLLASELTIASYPTIGKMIGGRDHTTVMKGAQRMK